MLEKSKKVNINTIKFLSTAAGKTKAAIATLTLLQSAAGMCGVLYALFLRDMINSAVSGEKKAFFYGAVKFLLLVCFQIILNAVIRWLDEKTRAVFENRLKKRLFSVLLYKDFAEVSAVHSGEWLNRLTSDTVVTADAMTQILPGLGGMSVKLIGAAAMIILIEPKFCAFIITGGVLLIILSYCFRKAMKKLHKNIQEQDGKLRSFLQEILESHIVIRSFAAEDLVLNEADKKMKLHKKARMKRNHFSNICNSGFGTIISGAYFLSALYCGYGILTANMTYGTFTAVMQLVGQIQAPFANISGFLPRFYAMLASAERLMEAECFSDSSVKNIRTVSEANEFYAGHLKTFGLKNASFSYIRPSLKSADADSGTPAPVIIKNVDLEIKKGEYIAFTGQSGCGKSTLLKLLLCLYPLDSGERYILSDAGNAPLTVEWQKLFAYVPQGNYLMSGTIREIISISAKSGEKDDRRINEALKIACAYDFVSRLQSGVDTYLGERGSGLSEGQTQRIAIARAVFSDRPILMLDECTSALDEYTEKEILNNLRSMTNKTVLIITHRPAALEICGKIIEFSDNNITMRRNNGQL